ncbi:hypothetical protein, partial [Prevotella sp. HMSC073D09]|uniref:hypothetical protein n=1 Tax=Prevotella sp. HMSC073D09 TaxID=1739459 RepID=UPI001AF01766
TKTHYILLQIALKWAQMTVSLNKNSFCRIHILPPFCIKTNLRENRFFAQDRRLVDGKGTHNVKSLTEN